MGFIEAINIPKLNALQKINCATTISNDDKRVWNSELLVADKRSHLR